MDEITQFDKMIGRKMRYKRLEADLTQKKLAQRMGISFQQVQKYEAGINRMSAERLWKLSEIFSVPFQYWVGGAGETAAQMIADTDRRAAQVAQYYSRIEDETIRNLLFAFTRALAVKEQTISP